MVLEYNQFDIPELSQQRQQAKKEYFNLKNDYQDLEKTLNNNIAEYQQLEKKYALILKQIQLIKNDNFSISRKKSTLSNAAHLLIDDIEKKEYELKRLTKNKNELDLKINQFKTSMLDFSSLKEIQKKVCKESEETISNLINEKNELSEEISDSLGNISTEKESIEDELNQLNMNFMKYVSQREESAKANEAIKSTFDSLTATKEKDQKNLKELESALKHFNELESVVVQYEKLKKENEVQQAQWESLKKTSTEKKDSLDKWETELQKKKQEIQKLEEDVKDFDSISLQYEQEHQSLQQELGQYKEYTEKIQTFRSDMADIITFLSSVEDHDELIEDTIGNISF